MAIPFVAQHSLPILEYIDSQKESRTGYTRYSQGLDSNSLNKTARGMGMIMNMSQQRVNLMVTLFGECLKAAMRGAQKLLSRYGDRAMTIRLTGGQYINIDPREWRSQYDLTMTVGLGVHDPQQRVQMLTQVAMAQQAAIAAGGMGLLVTPKNVYNTQKRIVEAAGEKDPALYWTDPGDKMPQPPPDPKAGEVEARAQAEQAKMQADVQKFQATSQIDREKHEADMQLERERMQHDAQLKLQMHAMTLQANGQTEAMRVQAASKPAVQVGLADGTEQAIVANMAGLAQQMAQMQEQTQLMMAQLAQAMTQMAVAIASPKEIVRDANGRVAGSKTVLN